MLTCAECEHRRAARAFALDVVLLLVFLVGCFLFGLHVSEGF